MVVADGGWMWRVFSLTNQLKWPLLFKFFFILRDAANTQMRARRDLPSVSLLEKI
jgi:hypothetical protein